jgi:RNA-binding protein
MKQKIELRSKGKSLDPSVRIGKNGLSEGAISEINKLLKIRKLIKIKILNSALHEIERKEFVKNLVEKTGAELIESVGFVVVLYKE